MCYPSGFSILVFFLKVGCVTLVVFLGFISVTKALRGWPKEKIMTEVARERARP